MKIDSGDIKAWLKEISEILIPLFIIIILSKLLLGPDMLIPLVAVTSESMLHTSNSWHSWLLSKNISEETIRGFPVLGGFAKGDMIVTITPNSGGTIHNFFSDTKLGDVVIYKRDKQHMFNAQPIIHRVVGVVEVRNWSIESVDGTLDCLSEKDFKLTYIPKVRDCVEGRWCPYVDYPKSGDFRLYITKGDNNPGSDQCLGIALPVTETQLTARAWVVIPYVGWFKLILNMFIPL